MKISVVVPVRNEQDNIEPLLEELSAVLSDAGEHELIYVDDGSTDGTLAKLKSLRQRFPSLRILHHRHSCGQSAAIVSGVRAGRGRWIVTLDGDGQNDPADIPRLLETIENTDPNERLWMVVGHRKKRRDTGWRRFSSRVANGVRSRLLGDETPDTGCGLKVFSREKFLMLPYFDHMHRFLPALMRRAGGRVLSLEVNHRPRTRGTSNYGTLDRLWAGIVDLLGVMWLQKRSHVPEIEEIGFSEQ